MKLSVLIPHFRNGKVTAYSVSQFLKYKGANEIDIVVINNSYGHDSIDYLDSFLNEITVINHISDKLSSHGIAYDSVIPHLKHEYFICAESDSFPTIEGFYEYYEVFEKYNVDLAGSFLQLSGGSYLHPCGAIYKKSLWLEAAEYCAKTPYHYLPNSVMVEGFPNHLMIHNEIWDFFLQKPNAFVQLPENRTGLSKEQWDKIEHHYSSVKTPFHNGMGRLKETYSNYGKRTLATGMHDVLLDEVDKIIPRMGLEPGQWLSYYACAKGKNVAEIPTKVKWLPNRENQQQEYTEMENGLQHIWAGSSYLDMKGTEYNDVFEFKKNQIEELYQSMLDEYKIKNPE